MKTLSHHLAAVRSRPAYQRKQITFALAAGATALVALVWLVASLSSGAFRVAGSSYEESPSERSGAPAGSSGALLGAAAAALAGTSTAPALQVVGQGGAAGGAGAPADTRTVIPF
jgi:hypothetical protein